MPSLEERIKLLTAQKKRAVADDDYDKAKQLSFTIRRLKLKLAKRKRDTRASPDGSEEDGAADSSAPTPQKGESRTSTSSGEDKPRAGKRRKPKAKIFHKDPQPTCSVIASDDEDDDFTTERTSLSLSNRGLRMVPLQLARKHANACRRLDMTGNKLRTGDNLDCFNQLETLILDRCGLSSIEMLPPIPNLRTLWLNHNNFSELSKLASQLKERFPKLTYLSLLKNPLCPDLYFSRKGSTAQYKKYRRTIVYSLKRLQCLDARPLTKEDHADAKRNGKFLAAAKPKTQEGAASQWSMDDDDDFHKDSVADLPDMSDHKPAAFIGRGRIKYDGRDSEGNRFIRNNEL